MAWYQKIGRAFSTLCKQHNRFWCSKIAIYIEEFATYLFGVANQTLTFVTRQNVPDKMVPSCWSEILFLRVEKSMESSAESSGVGGIEVWSRLQNPYLTLHTWLSTLDSTWLRTWLHTRLHTRFLTFLSSNSHYSSWGPFCRGSLTLCSVLFREFCNQFDNLLNYPLIITMSLAGLYIELGWNVLFGVAVLVVVLPINYGMFVFSPPPFQSSPKSELDEAELKYQILKC